MRAARREEAQHENVRLLARERRQFHAQRRGLPRERRRETREVTRLLLGLLPLGLREYIVVLGAADSRPPFSSCRG